MKIALVSIAASLSLLHASDPPELRLQRETAFFAQQGYRINEPVQVFRLHNRRLVDAGLEVSGYVGLRSVARIRTSPRTFCRLTVTEQIFRDEEFAAKWVEWTKGDPNSHSIAESKEASLGYTFRVGRAVYTVRTDIFLTIPEMLRFAADLERRFASTASRP